MRLLAQVKSLKRVIEDVLRHVDSPCLEACSLCAAFRSQLTEALAAIPAPPPGVPSVEDRLYGLIKHAGDPGTCKGCGAPIKWFHHPMTGAKTPYDTLPDTIGSNHFITCPQRKKF